MEKSYLFTVYETVTININSQIILKIRTAFFEQLLF